MEYWIATQRALQGGETSLVLRPRLTDTLLRKPPFRFLHDIVSEVTRQTGFAKDLFNGYDLVSANLKDKEGKVGYLTKIINCVGICLEAHVPARPLKIVAGLEPEQTNIFLQMLAAATTVDEGTRHNAVRRTLAGESMPTASKGRDDWISRLQMLVEASHPSAASSRKSSLPDAARCRSPAPVAVASPPRAAEMVPEPSISPTRRPGYNESLKASLAPAALIGLLEPEEAAPALSKPTKDRHGGPANAATRPAAVTKDPYAEILEKKSSSKKREKISSGGGSRREAGAMRGKEGERGQMPYSEPHKLSDMVSPYATVEHMKPPGSAGSKVREAQGQGWIKDDGKAVITRQEEDHAPDADTTEEEPLEIPRPGTPLLPACMVPPVERPQSARLGPPKLPSNMLPADIRGPAAERPASAASGRDIKKPNILLDDATDDQENEPVLLQPPSLHEVRATSMAEAGKLVRDILETKRELEDVAAGETEETGIILGSIGGQSSPFKNERLLSKQDEIEKLRAAVQKLCQATNPLGKCVDNLQEGMQSMAQEYQHWMKELETYNIQLQEERKITEKMLQAEAGRITELEEEISQQQHRIDSSKAQVLRNEGKIMSLLRRVTTRAIK